MYVGDCKYCGKVLSVYEKIVDVGFREERMLIEQCGDPECKGSRNYNKAPEDKVPSPKEPNFS